jgi:hypothetical protein
LYSIKVIYLKRIIGLTPYDFSSCEFRASDYLQAVGYPRQVVRDPEARYVGGRVEERSLVPLGEARLGRISFDEWLRRSQARA